VWRNMRMTRFRQNRDLVEESKESQDCELSGWVRENNNKIFTNEGVAIS